MTKTRIRLQVEIDLDQWDDAEDAKRRFQHMLDQEIGRYSPKVELDKGRGRLRRAELDQVSAHIAGLLDGAGQMYPGYNIPALLADVLRGGVAR